MQRSQRMSRRMIFFKILDPLCTITRRTKMKQVMLRLVISLVCVLFIFSLSACKTTGGGIHLGWGSESKILHPTVAKGGPPAHAPAHGYRAKYTYRYYPSASVYFDSSRKVYFWLQGDNWTMSASLPQHIRLTLGNCVTIDMDTDKPYTRFKEHKRRYPPGKMNKNKKGKWPKSS